MINAILKIGDEIKIENIKGTCKVTIVSEKSGICVSQYGTKYALNWVNEKIMAITRDGFVDIIKGK